MGKKKVEVPSVALFDDEPVSSKKVSKKVEKKSSRSKKEAEPKASTKKTSKPTTKNKTVKNDKPSVISSNNKSSSRSSTSSKSNTVTKRKGETSKTERRRTSDSSKKSGKTISSNPKDSSKSSKVSNRTSKSRQSIKNLAEPKPATEARRNSTEDTGRAEEVKRSKSENNARIDELFKEAKKNKFKFARTSEVWGPKIIEAGPRKIGDDFLVGIVVDGKYLEVSPWSIKDNSYHQGLDSNYIVKYLHFNNANISYEELMKQRQDAEEAKAKRKKRKD